MGFNSAFKGLKMFVMNERMAKNGIVRDWLGFRNAFLSQPELD